MGIPPFWTYHRHIRTPEFSKLDKVALTVMIPAFLIYATIIFLVDTYDSPQHWNQVSCASNLKQIGLACHMYSQDYGDYLPDKGFQQIYPDFISDPLVFTWPEKGHREEMKQQGERGLLTVIDYEYNALKIEKTDDSPDLILAFDREPLHQGSRNVLFLGGNVMELEEKEFRTRLENQKIHLENEDKD